MVRGTAWHWREKNNWRWRGIFDTQHNLYFCARKEVCLFAIPWLYHPLSMFTLKQHHVFNRLEKQQGKPLVLLLLCWVKYALNEGSNERYLGGHLRRSLC